MMSKLFVQLKTQLKTLKSIEGTLPVENINDLQEYKIYIRRQVLKTV